MPPAGAPGYGIRLKRPGDYQPKEPTIIMRRRERINQNREERGAEEVDCFDWETGRGQAKDIGGGLR